MSPSPPVDVVVLDVAGTLVDSVYQHTVAWAHAFRDVGVAVPAFQVHRAIGMGSDKLVTEVAGPSVERSVGDDVRELHARHFDLLWPTVTPLSGADRLIGELTRRGLRVAVATSGSRADSDRALDLVADSGSLDSVVTGDDGYATKPDGDLIEAAIRKAGGRVAATVGDAPWDMVACLKLDVLGIGVLTGGFTREELRAAGASLVVDSLDELIDRLANTAFGGVPDSD
jgi:phosphoglycolate phosphatase-like HAD superfamily hydrolase